MHDVYDCLPSFGRWTSCWFRSDNGYLRNPSLAFGYITNIESSKSTLDRAAYVASIFTMIVIPLAMISGNFSSTNSEERFSIINSSFQE